MYLVIAIVTFSLLLTTRSLGTWLRINNNVDAKAAKDAAEYGFNVLISQLNKDANGYLLVTNFNNWNGANGASRVNTSDLSSCKIYYDSSAPPSSTADPIPGVSTNSIGTKSEPVGDSPTTQSYSLTNYEAPDFASNTGNNAKSCGDSLISAAKFKNLLGGSATLTVTGKVTRNGNEAATYTLKRSVHVKFPNQAISSPIALLGDGSRLQYLNGRICQSENPLPNTCGVKNQTIPLTPIACADLEDCLCWNVDSSCDGSSNDDDEYRPRSRNKYCSNTTYKKERRYKNNIPCNTFIQLLDLPAYPALPVWSSSGSLNVYADSQRPTQYQYVRANGSADGSADQKTVSAEVSCVDYTYPKTVDDTYVGCTAYRYIFDSSNNVVLKQETTDQRREDFSKFPYKPSASDASFEAVDKKANLPKTLNEGCYYNSSTVATSTAINCVFGKFSPKIKPVALITATRSSFETRKADLKVWHTDLMPVNIWIVGPDVKASGKSTPSKPALDLDNARAGEQGGIYNDDTSDGSWKNLRIFGFNDAGNTYLNNDGTTPDGNNDCTDQTFAIGRSGRSKDTDADRYSEGRYRYRNLTDTQATIDGVFMWTPNATISISDLNQSTTSFVAMWVCKLTGPSNKKYTKNYPAIFTPLSKLDINAGISGLFNLNGGTVGINTYKAYGSKGTTNEDN